MNVANIYLFKENPSVILKRYKDWIGQSYFNLTTQKQRAWFSLPPAKVLNAYEQKQGENPSISYSCAKKEFSLNGGRRAGEMMPDAENSTYHIFRIDGTTQWAEKNWQAQPRKIEGIDQINRSIKGEPKGLPASYTPKGSWDSLESLDNRDPIKKILSAKSFEWSVIPKKDDEGNGVYVRWDFSPTLKELKASGDLDRACEMMLGKDYITIEPAKTTKAEPAKKNSEKKEEKQ